MEQNPYMKMALQQAERAYLRDEVPVGAVIVDNISNTVIAKACNLVEIDRNVTSHAEILAIKEASQELGNKYLENCDIYVTLEPCAMCAAAISYARIRRLYFGAYDVKSGGVEHGARVFHNASCHHRPEIYGGIMERECSTILRDFFAGKR